MKAAFVTLAVVLAIAAAIKSGASGALFIIAAGVFLASFIKGK